MSPAGMAHVGMPRTSHQPVARCRQLDGVLLRRVVGEPDPPCRAHPGTSVGDPRRPAGGLGARRVEDGVDEELPVAGRPDERRRGEVERDEPRAADVVERSGQHLAMDRRVADDAARRAAAAGLELGLDERDDLAAGIQAADDRRQDEAQRDEADVDDRERDRLAEERRREVAGVRPLPADDARIAAQRVGKLAAAHVDRVHAHRAALEQGVGEAAGRRADVEADTAGRVDAERVERARQLLPAARHVRQRRGDLDRDAGARRDRRACGRAGRRRRRRPARGRP